MKPGLFTSLSILLITAFIASACGSLPGRGQPTGTPLPTVISDTQVVAEGKIVPKETVVLSFFGSGQVEEILVAEGDLVKKGDIVARLGNWEQLEAAIAAAEAELVAAEQARKTLDDNLALAQADSADKMAAANKALKDAQYQIDNFTIPQNMLGNTPLEAIAKMKGLLDKARQEFEPYKYWSETNDTREDYKEKLDEAQADYNKAIRWLQLDTNLRTAETQLDETLRDYQDLQKGPDTDKLDSAESRVKAAQANLASAKANLENLELKATIDGTVVKQDLKVGQSVSPTTAAMTVADFSEWYAETDDLTEIEVVEIGIGQTATVVADALPAVEMNGVVTKIDQISQEKRGDITYTVRVKIMDPDPGLRWGMTVVLTFLK